MTFLLDLRIVCKLFPTNIARMIYILLCMVLLTPQFLVDIKDGNNYNVYIQEELFGQIDALKNQMIAAIEKRAQELTEGWVKK